MYPRIASLTFYFRKHLDLFLDLRCIRVCQERMRLGTAVRSKTRVGAAQTLQRAWRTKLRKKRGSVLQRQTLANKRAIKTLG